VTAPERFERLLDPFIESSVISPLDYRFALTMARLSLTPPTDEVVLGAAAASAALTRGDICLELSRAKDLLVPTDEHARLAPSLFWPEPTRWRERLLASPLVSDGSEVRPLVLDGERLYLHRYYDYQRRLAHGLMARRDLSFTVDEARLAATLDRLEASQHKDPTQRVAAEMAVRRGLTIISGGPGTGKTSTVVRILGALIEQKPNLRAVLVAPTGKAATRLAASIREQREKLPPELADRIPEDAATIHRRLGYRPQSPTRFAHDADNPLAADVVVLDEASMVDLALMTKLVEAVPPQARLIMLGDKDQLASVAAGHVLGDIAAIAAPGEPLEHAFAQLTYSHRFTAEGGVGQLAEAIKRGDPDEVIARLRAGLTGLTWVETNDKARSYDGLEEVVAEGLAPLFRQLGTPESALSALSDFQVLTAHRRGHFGAETLNPTIERWLVKRQLLPTGLDHPPGRPVIVLVNDPAQELYNGDTGITLHDVDGTTRVHFPVAASGNRVIASRSLSLAQLPSHAPLYAMTIHKAQGSGFGHVVCVLPPEPSPVTTRELLYTAVTRARHRVTLFASEAVVRHAVLTRVQRGSGLPDALRAAI
jgi:exodeoxyribonuclease V alpha subunit